MRLQDCPMHKTQWFYFMLTSIIMIDNLWRSATTMIWKCHHPQTGGAILSSIRLTVNRFTFRQKNSAFFTTNLQCFRLSIWRRRKIVSTSEKPTQTPGQPQFRHWPHEISATYFAYSAYSFSVYSKNLWLQLFDFWTTLDCSFSAMPRFNFQRGR